MKNHHQLLKRIGLLLTTSCLLFLFINSPMANAKNNKNNQQSKDPYKNVVFITNTVSWPYNNKTFGTDSFQFGTVKSKNEDAILLNKVDKENGLHFPNNFGWGVAYSSYQYEGNRVKPTVGKNGTAGVGWSLWDVFSEEGSWLNPQGTNIANVKPTKIYKDPNGSQAINGYKPQYYEQDIDYAKQLKAKYYRVSISWPRLFPKPGMEKPDPKGLSYYHKILKKLKEQNLEINITLYHWDLPAWLYNYGDPNIPNEEKTYGWLDTRDAYNNLAIKEFQKYADAVYKNFGQYSHMFATFNEPLTFTNNDLYIGNHAPGKYGWEKLREQLNPDIYGHNLKENLERLNYLQAANIIKAHYIAYRTFEKYRNDISRLNDNKPAMLSIVLNSDWAEPYRIVKNKNGTYRYHPNDIAASKRNMDFMLGWWLEPVLFGDWPESMKRYVKGRLPDLQQDKSWLDKNGVIIDPNKVNTGSQHYIRLNNYIREGGALDNISLNHYTGYFVADLDYAKKHFSTTPKINSIPPDQYGTTPATLSTGWASDQKTFTTQFRYQKLGNEGDFPAASQQAYIIGNSGAQSWLRQTWFLYRKLLNYINHYYLDRLAYTKQGQKIADLGIYLMENGTSLYGESQKSDANKLKDEDRIRYIKGNLAAVHQAIQEDGVNVKLYTYWSIADNFEWSEGYDSRFGLLWIDYQNDDMRIPKNSFYYYQRCIEQNYVAP